MEKERKNRSEGKSYCKRKCMRGYRGGGRGLEARGEMKIKER